MDVIDERLGLSCILNVTAGSKLDIFGNGIGDIGGFSSNQRANVISVKFTVITYTKYTRIEA